LLIKLWNDGQRAQVESARKHGAEACTLATNDDKEAAHALLLRAQGFVSAPNEELARATSQARRAACDATLANVGQALARVAVRRVELARSALYSPFDGTIAKIVGEVGEYSTPSPPGVPTLPAIDLIDDTCLYISAPMDEIDAPKISAGQPVRISFDALPKRSFPGTVRRVAPYVSAVEQQARMVEIEATLLDPSAAGKLLVGYSADVEVVLAVQNDVVRVPTSPLQEGGHVLVASSGGTFKQRQIKTGLANWEYTEVTAGLAAGERVVLSLERSGGKPARALLWKNQQTRRQRRCLTRQQTAHLMLRAKNELGTKKERGANRTERHRAHLLPRRQRRACAAQPQFVDCGW
jgi:HlyD family secretion protein